MPKNSAANHPPVRMTPKQLADLAAKNSAEQGETTSSRSAVDALLDDFTTEKTAAKQTIKATQDAAPKTTRTAPAGRPRQVKTLADIVAAQRAKPNVQAIMTFTGQARARVEKGQSADEAWTEVIQVLSDLGYDFFKHILDNKIVDIQGEAWKYYAKAGMLNAHATKVHVGASPVAKTSASTEPAAADEADDPSAEDAEWEAAQREADEAAAADGDDTAADDELPDDEEEGN